MTPSKEILAAIDALHATGLALPAERIRTENLLRIRGKTEAADWIAAHPAEYDALYKPEGAR